MSLRKNSTSTLNLTYHTSTSAFDVLHIAAMLAMAYPEAHTLHKTSISLESPIKTVLSFLFQPELQTETLLSHQNWTPTET